MKLLITGSGGQVGHALCHQALAAGWQVAAPGRAELDIADRQAVQVAIAALAPDVVINAAAYTAVDKAESDQDAAFSVNRDGPANLALACQWADIPLLHYSTDYVFDGKKKGPYLEDDPVGPLGVYGVSKLAGENAVREACERHIILRTSWVFSEHGHHFVQSVLRLGAAREELGVVADQYGKPTCAAEIARLTLELLAQKRDAWGTFHLAQPGATSWHGFAEQIFAEARRQGWSLAIRKLRSITTSEYPTPARRPANSGLDCTRLETIFGVRIRPWRDSLAEVVRGMSPGHREGREAGAP